MATVNSADKINREILRIWDSAKDCFVDDAQGKSYQTPFLSPCLFPFSIKPDVCKLLVIGLNPSYSLNGWQRILKERKKDSNLSPELKNLTLSANKNKLTEDELNNYFNYTKWKLYFNEIGQLENFSYRDHDYFQKMWELAKQAVKDGKTMISNRVFKK